MAYRDINKRRATNRRLNAKWLSNVNEDGETNREAANRRKRDSRRERYWSDPDYRLRRLAQGGSAVALAELMRRERLANPPPGLKMRGVEK